MTFILQVINDMYEQVEPTETLYIKECDHESHEGRGSVTFTKNKELALRFLTNNDALEFYTRQSKTKPLRPDGKPNRPLTCYTIEVIQK